jgi:3-oxoacyl-[acyl-carrier-protein] synthase-1
MSCTNPLPTFHRVAITGIGAISVLGNDTETIAQHLYAGKSGIQIDPERIKMGFRSPLTGMIQGFNEADYVSRKQRKTMTDFSIYGYAAVQQALKQAQLEAQDIENDRTGLIFGNDSSCVSNLEPVDILKESKDTSSIHSGYIFRVMTSNVTLNLNVLLKTRGACYTLSSACSSGGNAIGQAADLIAYGRQDRMICGGTQEINWQSVCSFDALNAFSTQTADPSAASRPFDHQRDGLVPSGGGAAVILERYDLAVARGAKILGEILGYGFSSDGNNVAIPSDDGIGRAMRGALQQARLNPAEIDYICAHATSTPAGDSAEARNILSVFGPELKPHIASTKSMTGHELWMSGASQVVYTTLMAEKGFIARNLNFSEGDEWTRQLNIVRDTVNEPPRTVLCNSAGFGGTNSCLAIKFAS